MKSVKLSVLLFSLVFGMSSMTTYARYKSAPLQKPYIAADTSKQGSVVWDYKVFTSKDCKRYLNNSSLIRKGFQPIQITILNNSNQSVKFSLDGLNMPIISADLVASSLHRNSVARGLGFGIPGLLFYWPLIIPAFVQGLGADEFNSAMDYDFLRKSLTDQVVAPYMTVSGIVFVPTQEFKQNLQVTLSCPGSYFTGQKEVVLSSNTSMVLL